MPDRPGHGEGESWNPQFRDVDVVPADLSQFAQLVAGDQDALRVAAQAAVDELPPQLPNLPGGAAAGDGMPEGAAFLRAYFLTFAAQLALLDDALLGLAALWEGADRIHADYLASDVGSGGSFQSAFAAYDRSSVERAFEVPPPVDGGPGDE
ncbi:MAG: hypothetical protein GEV12_14445 [Micromonosporaceae bacterium]|nr:hypothetical protein [Micromonosporaceae bacterium]